MSVTASKLREDVYNILDSVLETGEPVSIERKGQLLSIVRESRPNSRLARIVERPGLVVGDSGDFTAIDWSAEWQPEGNF